MNSIDLLIFIVYMTATLAVGVLFYKKNRSAKAFTLGNKNVPAWVISLSFFATFVSSISYLALPGIAFQENWSSLVFSLSIPVAALVAIKVFIPLYRKVNSPSAYAYLEQRFGPWARIYASTMYLLTQLMRVGTILYLMALTVNAVFNWDIATIIMMTGGAVAIYSILGGIQAVVWTDAIQAVVLICGAIVCLVYILYEMPEGPEQVFQLAMDQNKFSLGSFSVDLSQPTFWVILVYGIFINLQNYGVDQNYVQRYMLARTDKAAKRSAFWGGMLYLPVSAVFLFIGTSLFAYYQSGAGILPVELQDAATSDQVFPHFIVNQLPTGITGLMISSIFAAGMSTISTSYNSAATVILTDYVGKYKKTQITEKQKMMVLYLATLTVSILGILIGIAMINVKSALDTWWKLASVFSGGMLGLFLLGVFSKGKNHTGAVVGVVVGLLVILWLSLSDFFLGPETIGIRFHSYLTIVIGTLTIFVTGFLIGLITKQLNNNTQDETTLSK